MGKGSVSSRTPPPPLSPSCFRATAAALIFQNPPPRATGTLCRYCKCHSLHVILHSHKRFPLLLLLRLLLSRARFFANVCNTFFLVKQQLTVCVTSYTLPLWQGCSEGEHREEGVNYNPQNRGKCWRLDSSAIRWSPWCRTSGTACLPRRRKSHDQAPSCLVLGYS